MDKEIEIYKKLIRDKDDLTEANVLNCINEALQYRGIDVAKTAIEFADWIKEERWCYFPLTGDWQRKFAYKEPEFKTSEQLYKMFASGYNRK